MNFSELPAGSYVAKIADYGLEAVESMGGKLKVVIKLDIELPAPGGYVSGRWDGFLENKDGTPNKKTAKTLVTCGFSSDDLNALNNGSHALDMTKEYQAAIIKALGKDGKPRTQIEWINLPGDAGTIKKAQAPKASPKFAAALAEARKAAGVKAKPKNYAPQKAAVEDDDEIPF